MSVSIHGSGSIIGIDQGIQISGVTTFTGNVSVGGTLSYEDVTSIDSIGIITAKSGINVLAGGINAVGVVTATTFSGGFTGNLNSASIPGIDTTINETATDIFVYDTSKDSDGGAWRKRTQNTSWYNETLNTATRGSRREFPAVAVIVAKETSITIYDGDDPDLPMWMVFTTGTQGMANTTMIQLTGVEKVVYMLNGILVTGNKNEGANYGQPIINFINERVVRMDSQASEGGRWVGSIAERNETKGYTGTNADYVMSQSQINDISMTVLPLADVDPTTGMPTPAIAVATNDGVNIITGIGTVMSGVTGSLGTVIKKIDWIDGGGIVAFIDSANNNNKAVVLVRDYNVLAYRSWVTYANWDLVLYKYNYAGNVLGLPANNLDPAITDVVSLKNGNIATGINNSTGGLAIASPYYNGTADSVVAHIGKNYNTGYMQGKCIQSLLSSSDTTADSSELVTGGDFSDASYWTLGTGWSINGSGQAVHSGGAGYIQQTGSFTEGKWYQLTVDVVSGTVTGFGIVNHHDTSITQPHAGNSYADVYCVANGSKGLAIWRQNSVNLTAINLYANTTVTIDNVSIKEITEPYYNRATPTSYPYHLLKYGTITRSAVATGAELVGYSGFSANNVLMQYYWDQLDPGTSDYNFTCWFKVSATSAEQVIMRRFSKSSVTGGMLCRIVSGTSVLQWYVRDTSSNATAINSTTALDDGHWHCMLGTREGATAKLYIDGKLDSTSACSANSHNPGNDANFVIGAEEIVGSAGTFQNPADVTTLALMRYSIGAPTAKQVQEMYDSEWPLFQENAACTLYGSSNAVTAIGYNRGDDIVYAGTSSGRSDFLGLRRINNTTTAVTTAISASDNFIAEQ